MCTGLLVGHSNRVSDGKQGTSVRVYACQARYTIPMWASLGDAFSKIEENMKGLPVGSLGVLLVDLTALD